MEIHKIHAMLYNIRCCDGIQYDITIASIAGPAEGIVDVRLNPDPVRNKFILSTELIDVAMTAMIRQHRMDARVEHMVIVDLQPRLRRHMAAFCIQLYWRRACLNPMLSLAHKIQAARI